MTYLIAIVIGSVLGSFFGIIPSRVHRGLSFISGRSRCESCNREIPLWNNIPITSYIVNRGKCRFCGEKIAPEILLFEVLGAFFSLVFYFKFGFGIDYILLLSITGIYGVVFTIDFRYGDIYTLHLLVVLVLEVVYFYRNSPVLFLHFQSGLILCLLFTLIYIVFKGSMGEGDVLLSFPIGFIGKGLGAFKLFTYIFLCGAIYSIYLLIFKGFSRKTKISFGPFIILGALFYVVVV